MRSAALLAWGCAGEPPESPPALDRAEAEARAEALAAAAPPAEAPPAAPAGEQPAGEAVQVVLVWEGIGPLHRGFFSDAAAVSELGIGLGGRVEGPANVRVRYDSEAHHGEILLVLRPGTLRQPVRASGDLVALGDLAPITRALARYRHAVASRFDLRVESFDVGIVSVRGTTGCTFGVAGPPPPDGSVVSPCVRIGGEEVCGEPTPDGVRFPPEAARRVRTCLDL